MDSQELLKQKGHFESEARWLRDTLKELGGKDDSVGQDHNKLESLLQRNEDLKLVLQQILSTSDILTASHDVNEVAGKHLDVLRDIASSLEEDEMRITDVQSARAMLAEHKVIHSLCHIFYIRAFSVSYVCEDSK